MEELMMMGSQGKRSEGGEPNTVYIDPTYGSNGVGTIADPKNTFVGLTFQSNYTYKVKRGTSFTSSVAITVNSLTGVTIAAYGDGARPILNFTNTGTGNYAFRYWTCTNCTIANINITTPGTNSIYTAIQVTSGSGIMIAGMKINNIYYGITDGGMGINGADSPGIIIVNNIIDDVGCDGIYLASCNPPTVSGNTITKINQNYGNALGLGNGASGDGVQFDGNYNGFYFAYNIIDRTDAFTGNKYGAIFNSGAGVSDNASGIIEHNVFSVNAATPGCLHIERGNGIITRYNTFSGPNTGLRLGGAYTSNNTIHNNIFKNIKTCIGVGYTTSVGGVVGTKIYNNVFYNWTAFNNTNGGGCIWTDRVTIEVRNNIFHVAGNTGLCIYNYGSSVYTITNNCYETNTPAGTPGKGTASITTDPLFKDASNGNFRLSSGSPCIGAGIDVGITEDFEGNTNANLNLGVYF